MYEDVVVSWVYVIFLHKCFSQCLWKLLETLCASIINTKHIKMCFIFAILNSFSSLSVVFDLEARCVVKKIQEFVFFYWDLASFLSVHFDLIIFVHNSLNITCVPLVYLRGKSENYRQ